MTLSEVREEYRFKGMVSADATKWLIRKVGFLDRVNRALHKVARKQEAIAKAATALIEDVRRRYPGEELRCPYMRALDDALRTEAKR